MAYTRMTAADAAALIKNGDTLGISGFTPAGSAKAVTRELAAIALIYVVHELGVLAVEGVKLQNHVLCHSRYGRADATCRCEIRLAGVCTLLDVAHFEDSPVYLAVESIAEVLRHHGEMEVIIAYFVEVYCLAEAWISGVRCAEINGVSLT